MRRGPLTRQEYLAWHGVCAGKSRRRRWSRVRYRVETLARRALDALLTPHPREHHWR